ncbi:hypothetical protein IEQ34_006298 [Dendrobium chrysotoxum]|uniref:Uncharacterized protein n=1 Tax=Dendrobium chrysotoxum TaxID=161865 RepID=A0AAV7HDH4_DENCH|nr:hypothetical protein IEQ34_006298 [Dendrobium chrysotoxum]
MATLLIGSTVKKDTGKEGLFLLRMEHLIGWLQTAQHLLIQQDIILNLHCVIWLKMRSLKTIGSGASDGKSHHELLMQARRVLSISNKSVSEPSRNIVTTYYSVTFLSVI